MDGDFTNSEVSKGKGVINSPLLTEAGKRWLVRALDPFHDSQVEPAGYPDMEMSATVIQEINMSVGVGAPIGSGGNNWDCHIFNWCDFAVATGSTLGGSVFYNFSSESLSANGSAAWPVGGLGICSVVAGNNITLPTNDGRVCLGSAINQAINPIQYMSSKCRVVGMAFEVTNTTAELYKQGVCTAYRMPQIDKLTNVKFLPQDGGSGVPTTCHLYTLPPGAPELALVLPASKQWAASEGFYGVCTLQSERLPLVGCDNLARVYTTDQAVTTVTPLLSASVPAIATTIDNTFVGNNGLYYNAPYNTTGAYFTGLSPQTTLQVTLKLLIETAPGASSPFVTLAKPSPMYDPEALRLYTQVLNHLSVAVPVTMNPSGEWFQDVLGTLGSLSMMASGINPLFGMLGAGLKVASGLAPTVHKLVVGNKEGKPKKKKEELLALTVKKKQPALAKGVKQQSVLKTKKR